MARKDLLSEAIADAKAVKETALANAKLALEEAFTPKLQSMISAKLAEEMDDEDMEETYNEEELELGDETLAAADDMEDEMEIEDDSMEMEEEMDYEEGMYNEEDDMSSEVPMEDDEELDLDEVIKALREMEDEYSDDSMEMEEEDDSEEKLANMAVNLGEAYATIKSLRSTINEVNLLNAKLLYTNKLFRVFDLNESQKVKVLENFDRTSSVREVKLVFSTIAENLNVAKRKKTVVKEGYASKTIKSSAPRKKIITESNDMAARWKKLAGLK